MANTNAESVATLVVAKNQVEIHRTSAIRRLFSSSKKHSLVLLDEQGQSVVYLLDTELFEKEFLADYGEPDNEDQHLARVAEAIFSAVLGGKPFWVLAKNVVVEAAA